LFICHISKSGELQLETENIYNFLIKCNGTVSKNIRGENTGPEVHTRKHTDTEKGIGVLSRKAGVTKEVKEGVMLSRNLIQQPLRNNMRFTTEETTESGERFASVRERAFVALFVEKKVISLAHRTRRGKESVGFLDIEGKTCFGETRVKAVEGVEGRNRWTKEVDIIHHSNRMTFKTFNTLSIMFFH
jgi:hypothetical protein